jgi:hypothetical protein
MRRIYGILAAIFIGSVGIYGQIEDTNLVKNYRLDLAVPDHPAFSILGTTPADILRPSNVKELSVNLSDFFGGSDLILPKAFALEAAPFLIARANKMTLADYDRNKIVYSLRLSLGTGSETLNKVNYTNLAAGVRFTLIDKGDLKNDPAYRDELWSLTADELAMENKYKMEFLQLENKSLIEVITDSVLNSKMESYIAEQKGDAMSIKLKNAKDRYKEQNWNRQKLDIAYAFKTSSPDSLLKNVKAGKHAAWITGGLPVKDWGQVLIGLNYAYVIADSTDEAVNETFRYRYSTVSLASRMYAGTNRFKGFLEVQYKYDGSVETNNFLLNSGAELNINNGIWLVLEAGIVWNDPGDAANDPVYRTGFSFRFNLPEN